MWPWNSTLPMKRLARPISFDARYGEGAGRTLVLGGGGVYYVAWQVAYLNGLIKRGVELSKPRSSSEHQRPSSLRSCRMR